MKIAKLKIKNSRGGYTIIELLFYLAFFALLTLAVINSMIVMSRAFKQTTIHGELIQSGNIMERISREIRQAISINTISSTSLTLNTKDAAGASKTVEFTLSGPDIALEENSVLTGNLNTPNISVSSLSFTQVPTAEGTAVKVILIVQSENDTTGRVYDYYNTVVLRGNYQ